MRQAYSKWFSTFREASSRMFMKYKVDSVEIATDQDYVRNLMAFFQKR